MTEHADTIRALLDDVEHWRLERSGPSSIAEIQEARAELTTLLAERQQAQKEIDQLATELAEERILSQQAIDALREAKLRLENVDGNLALANYDAQVILRAALVKIGEQP